MPHSRSIQGWEQSEEVAKRLLDDMRSEEELVKQAKDNERAYGHLVAEAHRRGISVERPWEQDEVKRGGGSCLTQCLLRCLTTRACVTRALTGGSYVTIVFTRKCTSACTTSWRGWRRRSGSGARRV